LVDATQPPGGAPRVSKAILVTLLALGSTNAGLVTGIYAASVGDRSLYASSVAGGSTFVVTFTLALAVATYVRDGVP
jgi:hypothetical protein